MKRNAQPETSKDGQQALNQYMRVLQQLQGLSPVTIRNYLSDLRQFITQCEGAFWQRQGGQCFAPLAMAPSVLVRYRRYFQTMLNLKLSMVNHPPMSLKHYFACMRKIHLLPSEKRTALIERAPGHLVAKYAVQAQIADLSPHNLSHRFDYRMAEVIPCIGSLRSWAMIC